MAKPIPLPLGLQSAPGRYSHDSGARLINAYAEKAANDAKLPWILVPIEGLSAFATLTGGGAFRGGIRVGDNRYVVSGTAVFKVTPGGGASNIGSFPGSSPAFMAKNRNDEVIIVSDGLRYSIISDTVATIADSDLPSANSCAVLDGYAVCTIQDGRVFLSAIDDVTDWDAGDVATAEANSDKLLVAHTRAQEVCLFGDNSIEFWRNTGASYPLERVQGTTIQNLGVLGRHTVKDLNDVVFFIASDGTVRRLDGYQPVRISTHDVERSIDSIENKDNITATAYSYRGHQFYTLSASTFSWTYDALSQSWHERQSYGLSRWMAEGFIDGPGAPVVGDYDSGLLYNIDADTYDESGSHLIWTIRTPPIQDFPNRLVFNRLYLDTIPGAGLNSGDDHEDNPKIMLSWSDNGGKTFGTERTAETGKIGQFNKQVRFNRLGMSKEDGRIFDISMSAAVIRGLTGGAVEVEPAES